MMFLMKMSKVNWCRLSYNCN